MSLQVTKKSSRQMFAYKLNLKQAVGIETQQTSSLAVVNTSNGLWNGWTISTRACYNILSNKKKNAK